MAVDYKRYLASREWRVKRKEVIERNDGWCERCHSAPIADVHHVTYAHIGDEPPEDLQGVCRPCHAFISAEQENDPRSAAMLALILQNGLRPELYDPKQILWWCAGVAPSGYTLCVDFENPLSKQVNKYRNPDEYAFIDVGCATILRCWWI